jgi:hypothetical protein
VEGEGPGVRCTAALYNLLQIAVAGQGSTPRGPTTIFVLIFSFLSFLLQGIQPLAHTQQLIEGKKGTWCTVHGCSTYLFRKSLGGRTGSTPRGPIFRSFVFFFFLLRVMFSSRRILKFGTPTNCEVETRNGCVPFPRSQSQSHCSIFYYLPVCD